MRTLAPTFALCAQIVEDAGPARGAFSMTSKTSSKTTTDHDTIRNWAEKRGGVPATVEGTEKDSEEAGILRLEFRKYNDLEQIDWDAFFEKFEKSKLAFLYQDKTAGGRLSRFHKFIQRH
jgi:hypothetical protein